MIADWTVEAGGDNPLLVLPWEGWVDLRDSAAGTVREAVLYPELIPVLLLANTRGCQTAKVDVFPVHREDVDPEISDLPEASTAWGLGSYLDCFVPGIRSFPEWESIARQAVALLRPEPLLGAAAEVVLRSAALFDESTYGCTLYAMGFGATETEARETWRQAALLVVRCFLEAASQIAVPRRTRENRAGTL